MTELLRLSRRWDLEIDFGIDRQDRRGMPRQASAREIASGKSRVLPTQQQNWLFVGWLISGPDKGLQDLGVSKPGSWLPTRRKGPITGGIFILVFFFF